MGDNLKEAYAKKELRGSTIPFYNEMLENFYNTLWTKIIKPTIKHMRHEINIRRYPIKASRSKISTYKR